jgi:hypothetical protein
LNEEKIKFQRMFDKLGGECDCSNRAIGSNSVFLDIGICVGRVSSVVISEMFILFILMIKISEMIRSSRGFGAKTVSITVK